MREIQGRRDREGQECSPEGMKEVCFTWWFSWSQLPRKWTVLTRRGGMKMAGRQTGGRIWVKKVVDVA